MKIINTILNRISKMVNVHNNIDRTWHEKFVEYTESIVAHPNYDGLFYERKSTGQIKWVVAGKSQNGKERQRWWDEKCNELGIPIKKGCYAKVAAIIHPTKKHTCQICGREMSVFYEYPTARTIKKLSEILSVDLEHFDLTISEIVEQFCLNENDLNGLNKFFKVSCKDKNELIEIINQHFVKNYSNLFSPGVMSNPPDRFDGFHSDGACCRSISDKGRHKPNMKTYTQDRRAYEHWADGDFNAANRLMGEFQKTNNIKCPICGKIASMTADHIGPISLGFSHRPKFNPMCLSCNSAKNNRFTYSDVLQLIEDEAKGESVISWHSKDIWELLKNEVKTDDQAKTLSNIMLTCHQNVLKIFSIIYHNTGKEFLKRYLNPEFAMFDVRFDKFDSLDLSKLVIIKNVLDSKNKESNKNRYLRISFEALEDFDAKINRKTKFYIELIKSDIIEIVDLIKSGKDIEADVKLKAVIKKLSEKIYTEMWSN
ncbi:MAG: restriction endonuclease [Paludibacter sp.]|nr:restriction endonuclease [Paludibacter sp.]